MTDDAAREGWTALDCVPEAVLVLDDDHVVQHANDRALSLLGLPEDAIGVNVTKVLAVEDETGMPCEDVWIPSRTIASRMAERVIRVALPDGRSRPVSVAGRFVDGHVVLTFRSAGGTRGRGAQ